HSHIWYYLVLNLPTVVNPLEISEYFYYYRRLWKDVEHRYRENQFTSYKEVLQGIERRKRLKAKLEKQTIQKNPP
ncbi:MAG: hypothetical protein ACUVXA_17840, partial [Candidatus Jordarchaeum sp.]